MTLKRKWLLDVTGLVVALIFAAVLKSLQDALGVTGAMAAAIRTALVLGPLFYFWSRTNTSYKAYKAEAEASGEPERSPSRPLLQDSPSKSPLRLPSGIWILGLGAAGLLAGGFYWYEYRPSHIRAECERLAIDAAKETLRKRAELYPLEPTLSSAAARGLYFAQDKDQHYVTCTRRRGLNDG